MLTRTALFCNNARFSDDQYQGDPTETALLRLATEGLGNISSERISEIPFDSDRKRMTTLNRMGDKEYVFTKGAMESILPICSRFLFDGAEQKMDEPFRRKATDAYHELMDRGLRVLAFAYRESKGQGAKGREFTGKESIEPRAESNDLTDKDSQPSTLSLKAISSSPA